jgi:hypothetical protein
MAQAVAEFSAIRGGQLFTMMAGEIQKMPANTGAFSFGMAVAM